MSSAGRSNDADLPTWIYLVGVVSILFVIYVWQAPLDWFAEFVSDRLRSEVAPPSTSDQ